MSSHACRNLIQYCSLELRGLQLRVCNRQNAKLLSFEALHLSWCFLTWRWQHWAVVQNHKGVFDKIYEYPIIIPSLAVQQGLSNIGETSRLEAFFNKLIQGKSRHLQCLILLLHSIASLSSTLVCQAFKVSQSKRCVQFTSSDTHFDWCPRWFSIFKIFPSREWTTTRMFNISDPQQTCLAEQLHEIGCRLLRQHWCINTASESWKWILSFCRRASQNCCVGRICDGGTQCAKQTDVLALSSVWLGEWNVSSPRSSVHKQGYTSSDISIRGLLVYRPCLPDGLDLIFLVSLSFSAPDIFRFILP